MAQLGSCDYYGIPHEYSAMTCKHWHPAAPAPQAEGTNKLRVFCEIHQEYGHLCREVGAAPAETAQHERIDEEGGKHYPGETAGEMTATQLPTSLDSTAATPFMMPEKFWEVWTPPTETDRLYSDKKILFVMFHFAEAFAKQRVEQAERRCCGDAHAKLESALAMIAECGFAQKTVTHPGHVETLWHNPRAELAEAKVAELERERDTLEGKLMLASDSFIALRTELREMREALQVTAIFSPHNHQFAGDDTKGCPKCDAERLLARKAGS